VFQMFFTGFFLKTVSVSFLHFFVLYVAFILFL